MTIPWRSAERLRLVDRRHAGAVQARRLQHFADRPDVVVLALPRGGVAGAFEVGQSLGAREACEALRANADEVVCALMPEPFTAVGLWYIDFSQTTDDEVRQLLSSQGADAARKRSA